MKEGGVYAMTNRPNGILSIQREKIVKHWPRAWKANLIIAGNPDWMICQTRSSEAVPLSGVGPTWMAGTSPAMTVKICDNSENWQRPTKISAHELMPAKRARRPLH